MAAVVTLFIALAILLPVPAWVRTVLVAASIVEVLLLLFTRGARRRIIEVQDGRTPD